MTRVDFRAVCLSFLLVLLLDTVLGVAQYLVFGAEGAGAGVAVEQAAQALDAAPISMAALVSGLVLGTFTTVLGGVLVVRLAKQYPYFNGLALGLLGMLFGLAFWADYPLWFNLLALASSVPATLLGTHFEVQRRRG